jgi:hypothetical protein
VSDRFPDGIPKLPVTQCPNCGHKLDAASVLRAGPIPLPKPGDFSVCIGCATALTFGDQLQLQVMSESELAALKPRERANIKKVQATVRIIMLHKFLEGDFFQS